MDHSLFDLIPADCRTADLAGEPMGQGGLAGAGRAAHDDEDRFSAHHVVISGVRADWADGSGVVGGHGVAVLGREGRAQQFVADADQAVA
ncbi:hypothetical protein Adi01nite_75540 [Amorphoplanes digitatis]|nr:hypothetical protein Adi01nite_75540 [Actinoplanes digitatis]